MADQSLFLPVSAAYDRWSPFYDTYDNPMVFMASLILEHSLANGAGSSVFEFGCGTGRNLAALARRGATTISGCDFSSGMLRVARERGPDWRLFEQDMREPAPLPDHSVDLVLFSLTLEHLEDLRGPLLEAKRLMRPEGRIVIIEIHPFLSATGGAAHFYDGSTEVRMPSFPHQFADYLNAFAEVGLIVQRCQEWRPADVGNPAPFHRLERGPQSPLTLEFGLAARRA